MCTARILSRKALAQEYEAGDVSTHTAHEAALSKCSRAMIEQMLASSRITSHVIRLQGFYHAARGKVPSGRWQLSVWVTRLPICARKWARFASTSNSRRGIFTCLFQSFPMRLSLLPALAGSSRKSACLQLPGVLFRSVVVMVAQKLALTKGKHLVITHIYS